MALVHPIVKIDYLQTKLDSEFAAITSEPLYTIKVMEDDYDDDFDANTSINTTLSATESESEEALDRNLLNGLDDIEDFSQQADPDKFSELISVEDMIIEDDGGEDQEVYPEIVEIIVEKPRDPVDEAIELIEEMKKNSVKCHTCSLEFPSDAYLNRHKNTKKHKRALDMESRGKKVNQRKKYMRKPHRELLENAARLKKSLECGQVFEEIQPVHSFKNFKSTQNCQPVEFIHEYTPVQVAQNNQSFEVIQNCQPVEFIHKYKPVKVAQNNQPFEVIQNCQPVKVVPNYQSLDIAQFEVIQNYQPVEFSQNFQPAEVEQNYQAEDVALNNQHIEIIENYDAIEVIQNYQPVEMTQNQAPAMTDDPSTIVNLDNLNISDLITVSEPTKNYYENVVTLDFDESDMMVDIVV